MAELRCLQQRLTNPEPLPAQCIEVHSRYHDVPAQLSRVEIRLAKVRSDLGHKFLRNQRYLTSGAGSLGHPVIPLKAEISHRLHS
jgi:hypothetical protein